MRKTSSLQMGGDLTAKHFCASVELLYAADQSDFYLRQNELVDTGQGDEPAFDKATAGGKYKNLKFEGIEV